jgi:ATP-dependent RNA helicase DeaD
VEHQSAEQDEREHTGIARNQNVLFVLPPDAAAIPEFLVPAMSRLDVDQMGTQLLVLTPDAQAAVAVTEAATRIRAGELLRVLPVTSARRATRILRDQQATVVAGSPPEILELIRAAALKLDGLRGLVITWADAMADAELTDALEAVMAEVPRGAARMVVTSHMTPDVEELVERYARRPRREGGAGIDAGEPVDVRYAITAPQSRITVIHRLLDDLDPERAAIYARSDAAASELASTARSLGYAEGAPGLVITREEPVPDATLLVLYELPPSREVLHALATPGAMLVALIAPRQLSALRSLAGTGRMAPYILSNATARARTREERAREELRKVLAEGMPARELLAVEPLLAEYDGVEIAAAALRLLERERKREREVPGESGAARATTPGSTVRLFISIGTRDNVQPRDLVGAIANEAGVPGDRIGRIELREGHSLVEVPAEIAEQVATRLTGVTVRGRRLTARVDQPRGARLGRGERPDRGERAPRGGERRERYPRGGERGAGGPRGERRGARGERDWQRPRGGERTRDGERPHRSPRPRRPSGE